MKRIVTFALLMLIGGYGAAQAGEVDAEKKAAEEKAAKEAAKAAATKNEAATKKEASTTDFMGLKWGLGIGVLGSFGGSAAVKKASIITAGTNKIVQVEEEGELRPQAFLEMHAFLRGSTIREWRNYLRWKAGDQMAEANGIETTRKKESPLQMSDPPLWGYGPFIALQSGDNEVINALALGVMWGIRKDPTDSRSVNIGIGISFDPSVQVLAKGFKDGGSPPNNETAVRFKKEGRFGWAMMASFTF